MAMVPTTMPLAATTGLQVQLGYDEEREARRAAVLRDMETRLAALGTISINRAFKHNRTNVLPRYISHVLWSIQAAPFCIMYYTY